MPDDLGSAVASAHAAENGGTAQLDSQLVTLLRGEVALRRARVDELTAELEQLRPELKRYERILAQLSDEAQDQPPRSQAAARPRGTHRPARISPERLEKVRRAILAYAADHDEFRQVDIRGIVDISSSVMTDAFVQLRQDHTIR